MKSIFFLVLLGVFAACSEKMVVTKEYTDYLKKHVTWEVQEYEDNIFRGWTLDEAKNFLGLTDMNVDMEGAPQAEQVTLPGAVNWAGANCDHGVKNQGACGSCWAFAAAGMISDRCCIQSRDMGWLSPQELVSCDKRSYGCYGGSLTSPLTYMQQNGGLVPEACFPYNGQNSACPTKCASGAAWASSHVCKCNKVVNCYGTLGIKNCLMKGPVSVAFAVCQSFMSYKSGIYNCDCTSYIGGHATVAMGYSDTPSCNFYVKNSWGKYWGINGYFNMACGTCSLTGGPACEQITA